jgi:hypothetical protein
VATGSDVVDPVAAVVDEDTVVVPATVDVDDAIAIVGEGSDRWNESVKET